MLQAKRHGAYGFEGERRSVAEQQPSRRAGENRGSEKKKIVRNVATIFPSGLSLWSSFAFGISQLLIYLSNGSHNSSIS